jgi:hypothetical protein
MGDLGAFTRNEPVKLWAHFVDLSGSPIEPTNVKVVLQHDGTEIVNAAMTQLSVGSNSFYYDYTVPSNPTEGVVFAVYQGDIDGETKEGSDFFKIDLTKTHVLENRLGNQRILFFEATVADPIRNVAIGVLDREVIQTKYDDDADWSTPRSSHTLWMHYDLAGEINPLKVGEDA